MKHYYEFALLAGASVAALIAPATFAQTSIAPASEAPKVGVDEIIVTANKRAENVQDVPKSIQVVSGAALQQQNVTSIGDLQKLVPTIGGEGQTLAIRGVGTGASSLVAANKVGIVLDDVPQPSSSTLSNNLLDISRVEVLPGPQGTLAGRNATGGLVNLVTRGPTADWSGFVNLLYTSDQQKQAAGFIGGPVSDKIQVSMSQYYNGFRGLTKNVFLDKWSSSYIYGTRDKIKFLVSDNFTIDLTGFYQYTRQNGDSQVQPFAFVPAGLTLGALDIRARPFSQIQPGVTPSPRNREFASRLNGVTRTTDYGGIARFGFETAGGLTITSINSYLKETFERHQDFGLTGVIPLADLVTRPEFDGRANSQTNVEYYTTELRLNSPDSGPLHYVAGLYYSDEKVRFDFERYLFPSKTRTHSQTKSFAAYGHADYDITDQLKLQGGLRFEYDRVFFDNTLFPLLATQKLTSDGVIRNIPASNAAAFFTGKDKDSFFNFDVGAQYRVTPDVMFYTTYAQAKQGPVIDTQNTAAAVNGNLRPLPQESVKSMELGMKSQFFDRALTLNISLFNSKYTNYQVQTTVVPGPNLAPTRLLAAVGKVRTRGVEMSASARFSEHLHADLSLAYTEAKILSFPNAPCYLGQAAPACFVVNLSPTQRFTTQGDLSGNLLNNAPRLRATFSFDYSVPLNDNGLVAFVAPLVKYASRQHTNLLLDPLSFKDPTAYVDVNVGIRNQNMTAEFFVRNLFNEHAETYALQQSTSPNAVARTVVPERINDRYVGGRLRFSF